MADTPSQPEAHDTAEGSAINGNSEVRSRFQNVFHCTGFQERKSKKNNLFENSKASLRRSSLLHEIRERPIELNLSTNDVAITCCGSMVDNGHGDQGDANQCRNIYAQG